MKVVSLLRRAAVGFAKFWWDFLVGETPELFVAVLVIMAVVALVSVAAHANAWAVIVLPVLAIAALATSVRRATRRR